MAPRCRQFMPGFGLFLVAGLLAFKPTEALGHLNAACPNLMNAECRVCSDKRRREELHESLNFAGF